MRSRGAPALGGSLLFACLLGIDGTPADDTFSVLQLHVPNGTDPDWDVEAMAKAAEDATSAIYSTKGWDKIDNGGLEWRDGGKEVIHHHYGLVDLKLKAAIEELEGLIAEFKEAKKDMKSSPNVVSMLVESAKLKVSKWWKDTKSAAAMDRNIRKQLLNAEASAKEDALMSSFRMKTPEDVMAKLDESFFGEVGPAETFTSSKLKKARWVFQEKFKYYWDQMSKGLIRDRVLIKSWIYTQQGLYLSAFHSVFMKFNTGTKSQISHGLPIEQLEEVLKAVGDVVAAQLNESVVFRTVTPEMVEGIRKLANNKDIKLKAFLDGMLKLAVPEAKRPKVAELIMKKLKPSETKFVKATSVRPEVLELKGKMDLGPDQRKTFDLQVRDPLHKMLEAFTLRRRVEAVRKNPTTYLKRQEEKLKMSLLALGNQQYVTALRILLEGKDKEQISSQDISSVMDIYKNVVMIKVNNDGLGKEVADLFSRLNPANMDKEALPKLREWANDFKNVPTTDFAEKLIKLAVPDQATMRLFAGMFLNKMSQEIPSGKIPEGFIKK